MIRLDLPPEAEAYREEVRAWLDEHPEPTGRQLAEAGYTAPHWPRPYGRAASPLEQLAIDEVLR
ncbi:MAG TPA: acyl-CoA dehydrogenase, partial [Acidimicrobiia bacterium]|nr:acyl-CoA dehydrogenase [Acidimicrobiia bacterium]